MKNVKFWKNYLKVYDALNLLIPYQELLNDLIQELDIHKGEKILDAGCGTGNLALKIKEKGAQVFGLDNCKEVFEVYRRKDPAAITILADMNNKLPFSENFLDKIVSNNTLYCFTKEKQVKILKEFLRILKPGGKIVFASPKKNWKPMRIYIQGIKKNFEKEGLFKTIKKFLRLILPTIKIFYYNFFIRRESSYYFFEEREQIKMFDEAGFKKPLLARTVYAGEGLMFSAQKI